MNRKHGADRVAPADGGQRPFGSEAVGIACPPRLSTAFGGSRRSSMSDISFPWPADGDAFFSGDDHADNACLGWSHDEWYGYTEGYRRAVEVLTLQVLERGNGHDTLVYPIIFSARHYIEIKLKYLLLAASALLDRDSAVSGRHGLMETWRHLRPLLEEIFKGDDRGEIGTVQSLLQEFDVRDRSSMAFRYPVDLKGQSHHPRAFTIGLETFQKTFANLSSFFEACDAAIAEYSQYKHEMR